MHDRQNGSDESRAFDAFSQIHLATAAERAVFWCFASDPLACWLDAEIAPSARADISSVRWALRRFAEAGIVDEVEAGCFRWRAQLQYVLQRVEPEAERRDPVCGMPVTDDAIHRAEDVFGRTELFCSERCMAAFLVWPLVFMRQPKPDLNGMRSSRSDGSR